MLKRQIKHIITSSTSSANISHKTLGPLINVEASKGNDTLPGSNQVSMMHLFPPG